MKNNLCLTIFNILMKKAGVEGANNFFSFQWQLKAYFQLPFPEFLKDFWNLFKTLLFLSFEPIILYYVSYYLLIFGIAGLGELIQFYNCCFQLFPEPSLMLGRYCRNKQVSFSLLTFLINVWYLVNSLPTAFVNSWFFKPWDTP